MRTNKSPDAICCECGNDKDKSLDMFDICIGGSIYTICDLCNNALLRKTLIASCSVDSRIKQPRDMEIIRKRKR